MDREIVDKDFSISGLGQDAGLGEPEVDRGQAQTRGERAQAGFQGPGTRRSRG
jgi:hypothetical protein